MSIKINQLELENIKRIRAVRMVLTPDGLNVIGGKNNQGKTSVIDAIAWALGGDKYRPTEAQRNGSVIPPTLRIVMNNGLVVERKGKNSDLKVIDPNGQKGGQQLLNEFVEQLAIDLPRFTNASNKEKANILLKIIGVGDKLAELERQETDTYNRRRAIGQIADQKKKFADEQTYYPDAPRDLISASELIRRQQDILARNGENQRKRERLAELERESQSIQQQLDTILQRQAGVLTDLDTARKSARDLSDESTAELEQSISNVEQINTRIRANLDKDKAEQDALHYRNQYAALTVELDQARQDKTDLLKNAGLPLPGLSVEDGELLYNGYKWDCMSGSDQLKVSTAIVRKLNPNCGFVLMDKLEQMDMDTLREFGSWLETEGLQAIATRVSIGDECSIIIQDGYVVAQETDKCQQTPKWENGKF